MKKIFLIFLHTGYLLPVTAQSIITGNWTGILYQNPSPGTPFTEYKFSMKLEEKNGIVTGVSTIIVGLYFGKIELKGIYRNGILHFEEYNIQNSSDTKTFFWCLKSGDLTLTKIGTNYSLNGKWVGYSLQNGIRTECSPGTISLQKEIGFLSMKGNIIDSLQFTPVPALVKIVNVNTKTQVANFYSPTGVFDIKLPGSNMYEITIQSKGYFTRHEQVELKESLILNIPLSLIEVGQRVRLNHILFERSTSTLLTESYTELDRLQKFLADNPTVVIQLEGHTSGEGNPDDNMELSEQRAQAVKQYLVKNGISDTRIKTKAYGSTKPVAPNDTEENRRKNRRVEYLVISK